MQTTALCNVIPSTWDVLNFTVIEAMASGRPVICSRGAGASELIVDGMSGLLFDAGDAAGLAEAMRRMLAMPDSERLRMAATAREVVRERLDPDRNAAQRLDAYRAAIAAWQKPQPPLPGWLAEGFAQWIQAGRQRDRVVPDVEAAYPLAELLALDIRTERDGVRVHCYYAQCASLVGFLIASGGSDRFSRLCRMVRDGKSSVAALASAYPELAATLDDLERAWRKAAKIK